MRATRALLWCGLIGAPLFIVVFLVDGATRAGYDPLRHAVSSLALGDRGWIQVLNFLITGALMLAFAAGMRRSGGDILLPLLVAIYAIGLIGAGVFKNDPFQGYPPGAPPQPIGTTEHWLHELFSMFVFVGLPIAFLVGARRFAQAGDKRWAWYSVLTAIAFVVGFVMMGAGFSGDPTLEPIGGLMQRITIVIGWSWLAALALYLLNLVVEPCRRGRGESCLGSTSAP